MHAVIALRIKQYHPIILHLLQYHFPTLIKKRIFHLRIKHQHNKNVTNINSMKIWLLFVQIKIDENLKKMLKEKQNFPLF